jgi:hypothetical protein
MSEAHKLFKAAVEKTTLSELEIMDVLLYMRVLACSRKGRSYPPPSPEQWQRYPFWLKWKFLFIAGFFVKVYDLQKKLIG